MVLSGECEAASKIGPRRGSNLRKKGGKERQPWAIKRVNLYTLNLNRNPSPPFQWLHGLS